MTFAAHLSGVEYREKKLNKLYGHCIACHEYSECDITERKRVLQILFIPIFQLEITYIFNWKKCNHCLELVRKQDIKRYKEEQVDPKSFLIPNYSGMEYKLYPSPNPFSTISLVVITGIIVLILLILAVILYEVGFRTPWWWI
jgi:hypothetical protein